MPMFLDLTEKERSRYSVSRLVNAMLTSNPRAAAPFEYELADAIRQKAGPGYFGHGGVAVPDDVLLSRTLVTSSGSAGGHLKSVDVPVFHSALIEASWLERVPLQRWTGLVGDQRVPRCTSSAAATWLTTETTSATPSTPTFDVVPLTPKTCAVVVQRSRQHLLQTAEQSDLLLRDLGLSVGFVVAQACASGSGTNGEPAGLLSQITQDQPGAALSAAGVAALIEAVEVAGGGDSLTALCGTTAAKTFRTRERGSGGGFLLQNGHLLDVPCIVSNTMPSDALVVGNFRHALLANWGPTIEIVVTPFASGDAFRSGLVSIRAITSLDIGLLAPAAFAKATAIT
jgi:HK97 family phage major capsid protein